ILVDLFVTGHQRGYRRDTDASAQIAHQVQQDGGVAHCSAGNRNPAEGRQGNEQARQRYALQKLGPENTPVADVQIQASEQKETAGASDTATHTQIASIHPRHARAPHSSDLRESTRDMNAPTMGIVRNEPKPRGNSAMPACSAG